MKLTETGLARWEKIRTRGGVWVVLVRGVLGYGVLGAFTYSLLVTLLVKGIDGFSFSEFTRTLRIALIFWPIGGFLLSLWLWHYLEDVYYERQRRNYL